MGEKESKDNSKTLLVSIQSSWLSLPLLSHITTHSLTHKHFKFKKSNFKKSNFENFFPLPLSLFLSLFSPTKPFTVKTLILHFIWHFQINFRHDRRPSSRCWPGAFKSSLRRHFQSPLLQSQ